MSIFVKGHKITCERLQLVYNIYCIIPIDTLKIQSLFCSHPKHTHACEFLPFNCNGEPKFCKKLSHSKALTIMAMMVSCPFTHIVATIYKLSHASYKAHGAL